MPLLKWLMFHIPMSSPHRMRMFGLSVLAISISFDPVANFRTTRWSACSSAEHLHETQEHSAEGERADQDEGERNRVQRRLLSLRCHSGELRESSAPQVTNRPVVLPNRDDEGPDAAANQRKPQVPRRCWMNGRIDPRQVLQALEELDDREAETDQRDRRAYPRHHCTFEAEPRAQPPEMTVGRYPHVEPARAWTSEWRRAV